MKGVLSRVEGAVLAAVLAAAVPAATLRADLAGLEFDPAAALEAVPLVMECARIYTVAQARLEAHDRELAARGIAEEPMSRAAVKYKIDTGGLFEMLFDDFGELYIDRRFLSDEELAAVKRLEAFAQKHLFEPLRMAMGKDPSAKAPPAAHRRSFTDSTHLPVFRGFEDERYQKHDALVIRLVKEFNLGKADWCGSTPGQAAKVADLEPALVKAHMIEESGGGGSRSRSAWEVDPLQVNVPGDWGDEKLLVGLKKPSARNEGTVEGNVRAAIKYLSRKGFSTSARPAAERPKGFFDGWPRALQRYNGRRDRTDTDRYYSDEYADKIVRRAKNPDAFVPIEIKLAKKETKK